MKPKTLALCALGLLAGCQSAPLARWSAASLLERGPAPEASPAEEADEVCGGGAEDGSKDPPDLAPTLAIVSAPRAAPAAPAPATGDLARAAFIDAVSSKTKDLKALNAALAPASDDPKLDYLSFDRTLAVAVHRPGFRPADRLERIEVQILPVGFEFSDLSLVASSFADADLGRVTESTTTSGTLGGGTPSVTASIGASATAGYEKALQRRFQDADTTLQPRRLTLYRESAPGRDLTGTYAIPLAFSAPRGVEEGLPVVTSVSLPDPAAKDALAPKKARRPKKAAAGPADEGAAQDPFAHLGTLRRLSPDPREPLKVCARLSYVERRVVRGQAEVDEARQTVVFVHAATRWRAFVVLRPEERSPPLWRVVKRSAPNGVPVTASAPGRAPAVDFLSFKDAEAVRAAFATGRGAELARGGLRAPDGAADDLVVVPSPESSGRKEAVREEEALHPYRPVAEGPLP